MDNTIAINTYVPTLEFKKQNEQGEQKQTHIYREGIDRN